MTLAHDVYEYAGFRYIIRRDEHGKAVDMVPEPGQHAAANKDKHRRAALDMYLNDAGDFDSVRAAIRDSARREPAPESVPTPTRWRKPRAIDDFITAQNHITCPSCDGPITVGTKTCPTCGATHEDPEAYARSRRLLRTRP